MVYNILLKGVAMKKYLKISLLFVLVLVPIGFFVYYQKLNPTGAPENHNTLIEPNKAGEVNKTLTDPAEIFEITIDKKEVLEKVPKFDDPKIPPHITQKLAGREDILTQHLNEALTGMEKLLSETKAAFDEGRATAKPDFWGGREIIIKTATGQIEIPLIRDDGTFVSISRFDNNFRKTETISFHDDKKTVKYYMGPRKVNISFDKSGNLNGFGTVIDGKEHSISWGGGTITFYRISDIEEKPTDN